MSDEKFVASELQARASLDLQQEVEDELGKPDPSPEVEQAAIRNAIEDNSKDEQDREG